MIDIGDFCIYSFDNENNSVAVVRIEKFLNDKVAEVRFFHTLVDDTGNGFFNYLTKNNDTMNASVCYLEKVENQDFWKKVSDIYDED